MTSSNSTFNKSILPTNNVVIFGNSLINFNRRIKYNINRSLNNGSPRVKYFPGETSKDLLHYLNTTLQNFFVRVIHLGINDIVNNKNSLNAGHVLQSIENIALKSESSGKQRALIWVY